MSNRIAGGVALVLSLASLVGMIITDRKLKKTFGDENVTEVEAEAEEKE